MFVSPIFPPQGLKPPSGALALHALLPALLVLLLGDPHLLEGALQGIWGVFRVFWGPRWGDPPGSPWTPGLTSEARMEPPIQGLKRRSMVLLLAMSFSRMLWEEGGHWESLGGQLRNTGGNWE